MRNPLLQMKRAAAERVPLDFDSLYGKAFKVTDPEGDASRGGFSIVTPSNGAVFHQWKERLQFKELLRSKLNDPNFIADYKYQQIVDSAEKLGIKLAGRKVALDAVLETLDQEKTPQTDYTTQNGKMMGKGTEVEEGALNDAIPATLLASSKKSNVEPTCPVHGVVSPNRVHQCPKCREEGHYQKVTWMAHPKTSSSKCAACESGDCFPHSSLTGNTVNDLTNSVKPGVPETPLASDATFFKESDGDFEVTRTASGRLIIADTKSYGTGTPNGGTPSATPAPPAPGTMPAANPSATPPPVANPVPPVNSVNKTPQQLSQEAMNPATPAPGAAPMANGGALTQQQIDQVLNAVKGATVKNVVSRVRAAIRPHYASIGIKPSPEFLPPRDDMRSHLDETVKDEVKAGVTDKPDNSSATATTPQQPQQKQWQTPSQDALLNQVLSSKKAWYADEDDEEDDEHISDVGTLYGKPLGGSRDASIKDRLEYLRGQLRDEVISLGELEELQNLAEYIEPGDVELLEAAIGSSSSSNSGTPATEPKEPFSPNDDDKKLLREMGIKAKKAVITPGFDAWFRGSKITNPDGSPMLVHHGTARSDLSWQSNRPAYFTADEASAHNLASSDAIEEEDKPKVLSVYLSILNPAMLNWKESQVLNVEPQMVEDLKAQGYDGAIGVGNDGTPIEYIAFSSNQIWPEKTSKSKHKAKKAVQTEEGIHDACPGCGGVNLKKFDSEAEDGSLVECNDCGCFFAV